VYLFLVVTLPTPETQPIANIPLVLLPTAAPLCEAELATATPHAVEVQLE
tara:strand:- start:96 stop:245 length:150 start_codon:yes stop_codon:yes gene_type:complete